MAAIVAVVVVHSGYLQTEVQSTWFAMNAIMQAINQQFLCFLFVIAPFVWVSPFCLELSKPVVFGEVVVFSGERRHENGFCCVWCVFVVLSVDVARLLQCALALSLYGCQCLDVGGWRRGSVWRSIWSPPWLVVWRGICFAVGVLPFCIGWWVILPFCCFFKDQLI